MEVVILAAGLGSRLGRGQPKAIIEVAGKTILQRQLDFVRRAFGNVRVHVVGGYHFGTVKAICDTYANVNPILNPFYRNCGCVGSAFMALPHLQDTDVLRMDGDLVFTVEDDIKSMVMDRVTAFAVQKNVRPGQPIAHVQGQFLKQIEIIDEPCGGLEWVCCEFYRGGDYRKMIEHCSEISNWPYYMAVNEYIRDTHYARAHLPFRWAEVEGVYEVDTEEDLANAERALANR